MNTKNATRQNLPPPNEAFPPKIISVMAWERPANGLADGMQGGVLRLVMQGGVRRLVMQGGVRRLVMRQTQVS